MGYLTMLLSLFALSVCLYTAPSSALKCYTCNNSKGGNANTCTSKLRSTTVAFGDYMCRFFTMGNVLVSQDLVESGLCNSAALGRSRAYIPSGYNGAGEPGAFCCSADLCNELTGSLTAGEYGDAGGAASTMGMASAVVVMAVAVMVMVAGFYSVSW